MKILNVIFYQVYFLCLNLINHTLHPDIFNFSSKKQIIDKFHQLFYYSVDIWYTKTTWLGQRIQKCPLDLWIYQEIIYKLRPDIIIECGTYQGGSALYLASICDLLKKGKVVSIDIKHHQGKPTHKRIGYLIGSSVSDEIINSLRKMTKNKAVVMVILDSNHRKDHVYKELELYKEFVTKSSFLIVEDTNLNNHPVDPHYGPGPFEAVTQFLRKNKNFTVDKEKEKFYMTFNPQGYLLRKN